MQQGAITLLLAALVALALWWTLPEDNPGLGHLADLPCEIEAPRGVSVQVHERHSNMTVLDVLGKDRTNEMSTDLLVRVTNVSPQTVNKLDVVLELRNGDVVLETHRWGKSVQLVAGQVEVVRFVNSRFDATDVLKADRLVVAVR